MSCKTQQSKKRKHDEVSSTSTPNFDQILVKKTKYAQKKRLNDNFETLKEYLIESAEQGRNYLILNYQLSKTMFIHIGGELGIRIKSDCIS